MTQSCYPNPTQNQREFLEPLIPAPNPRWGSRVTDMVAVVGAIFYVILIACQRLSLLHDFSALSTIYTYFNQVWVRFPAALRRNIKLAIRILGFGSKSASIPRLLAAGFLINCRKDSTWPHINEHLQMQVSVCENHHPSPSAATCDARPVKVGNLRCSSVGFDGGKLIKGLKRNILVKTMGLQLVVIVTAANASDQLETKALFWKTKRLGDSLSCLVRLWSDSGHQGQDFTHRVMKRFHLRSDRAFRRLIYLDAWRFLKAGLLSGRLHGSTRIVG
jgi:hypothetical protein